MAGHHKFSKNWNPFSKQHFHFRAVGVFILKSGESGPFQKRPAIAHACAHTHAEMFRSVINQKHKSKF